MRQTLVFVLLGLLLVVSFDLSFNKKTSTSNNKRTNKVLVISFDGFPVRYFKNGDHYPTFDRIRRKGVFSESFENVFPGETFPNHVSLVTGLYTESHGMVSNLFYDPFLDRDFASILYENTTDLCTEKWWPAEPIWVTLQRLNLAKVATSMWPGDRVKYPPKNWTPYRSRPDYNGEVPFEDRIDEVMRWFLEDDVDMALMFNFAPDEVGHHAGVYGPAIEREVARVDRQMAYLLRAIRKAGLSDRLDLILCSDHAMSNIARQIMLDNYIDFKRTIDRISRVGARADLWPREGYEDFVYDTLKRVSAKRRGVFEVYRRNEVPERFHYRNNPRIAPIIILGYDGTFITSDTSNDAGLINYRAIHGWDPSAPGQQPIFFALGPSFKTGGYNATETTRGMLSKDIYAILLHLLNVDMAVVPPNNSTFDLVKDLFKNH